MGNGLVILTSILTFVAIILTLVFVIYYLRKLNEIKIEPNLPICFNMIPELAEGFVYGLEKKCVPKRNNKLLIKYIPIDINDNPDYGGINIQEKEIVIDKKFREAYARGDLSGEREIVIYHPRDPFNLPDKMTDRKEGVALIDKIFDKNKMALFITSERAKHGSYARISKEFAGGEITRDEFNKLKEIVYEAIKTMPHTQIRDEEAEVEKKR